HLQVLHLRVGEHAVDRVDGSARYSGVLEQIDPVLRRLGAGDFRDGAVDGAAVLAAALLGVPLRLALPLGLSDGVAEPFPQPRRAGGDVDVAVAGGEHAGRDAGRVVVAG